MMYIYVIITNCSKPSQQKIASCTDIIYWSVFASYFPIAIYVRSYRHGPNNYFA